MDAVDVSIFMSGIVLLLPATFCKQHDECSQLLRSPFFFFFFCRMDAGCAYTAAHRLKKIKNPIVTLLKK